MKKRHTLKRFNLNDVATAIGVSRTTLYKYLHLEGYSNLKEVSLVELVSFINKYGARSRESNST